MPILSSLVWRCGAACSGRKVACWRGATDEIISSMLALVGRRGVWIFGNEVFCDQADTPNICSSGDGLARSNAGRRDLPPASRTIQASIRHGPLVGQNRFGRSMHPGLALVDDYDRSHCHHGDAQIGAAHDPRTFVPLLVESGRARKRFLQAEHYGNVDAGRGQLVDRGRDKRRVVGRVWCYLPAGRLATTRSQNARFARSEGCARLRLVSAADWSIRYCC